MSLGGAVWARAVLMISKERKGISSFMRVTITLTIYQVNSTGFYPLTPRYQVGLLTLLHWRIFAGIYPMKEKEGKGMNRGDQFTKKNGPDSVSTVFFKFVEKRVDWIVLVISTLLILLVLVFFNV